MELLQKERPRLPVLVEIVYPMATTKQGEEADTGNSEVRSEEDHCHGGSNSAMLPTTEANDGQAIIFLALTRYHRRPSRTMQRCHRL